MDTFPRDDECRRAQYDEQRVQGEHDTMGFHWPLDVAID